MPTTNTNQSDDGIVEVTQADRDAAAVLLSACGFSQVTDEEIRAGKRDHWLPAQAFARHRIAEQGRCIAAISERRDAYVSAKAPGWREIEHECLQCEFAIRQTGEQR